MAETQASLFVNLDTTFTALAEVARPFIQESISEVAADLDAAIEEFPPASVPAPTTTALFRELRPGVPRCADAAPVLADALEIGTRPCAGRRPSTGRLGSRSSSRSSASPPTRRCRVA